MARVNACPDTNQSEIVDSDKRDERSARIRDIRMEQIDSKWIEEERKTDADSNRINADI
jgi:hypothetical protein